MYTSTNQFKKYSVMLESRFSKQIEICEKLIEEIEAK